MTARRVDQLLAGFAEGDGISRDAVLLQEAIRSLGYDSEIYAVADRIAPQMAQACKPSQAYAGRPGDVLIYQYAIASPATETFLRTPAMRVVRYQNVTPPEFFRGYDDALAAQLEAGRRQLVEVVRAAAAVWPASEFNAADIRGLGAARIEVLPLLFSDRRVEQTPDPAVLAKYGGPLVNLLFVGRIAPNKRIEDLMRAFACYQRRFNRFSRLILVGSERSCPRYYALLRRLAFELDLPNVCFEGYALDAGLAACYRRASLFVCASAHEGYCLPLVEAMSHQVPVIARASGGVPEAMGDAGVLYDELSPEELAALLHRVLTDRRLRDEILASQDLRVDELARRNPAAEVEKRLAL